MVPSHPEAARPLSGEGHGSADVPEISIVIPALNEERYIADTVGQFTLLNGVVKYEVIVADGGSSDRTVAIAQQHGAITCLNTADRRTTAGGRNLGARIAQGELLIFCDADTRLHDLRHFIDRVRSVFQDERLVGAVPRVAVFPEEQVWSDVLYSALISALIRIFMVLRWPFAGGQCQIVRRTSFESVQGYNEEQVHAEDSALFKKLARVGHVRFLSDLTVFESPRRYRKLGYCRLILTGLYSIIGQMLLRRNVLTAWERVD